MKITVLQNRIETLQTFIKDSIAFVCEKPIDYSLPIVEGFLHDTTGWQTNVANDSYYYEDVLTNTYIVFTFNRNLEVGSTYRISYDIDTVRLATFDLWLYKDKDSDSEAWENGRVSNNLNYENGSYYFDYTVDILPREGLGIRAKDSGSQFTISNIKIEKL